MLKLKLSRHFFLIVTVVAISTVLMSGMVSSATENTTNADQRESISIVKNDSNSSVSNPPKKVIIDGQEFEVREAGALRINIRDENGKVTTWGWWLVNIFAPWFVLVELVKIGFGILCLPFSWQSGTELIGAGWDNLVVMFPGLLVWGIGAFMPKDA
jgi:hypothetical protein